MSTLDKEWWKTRTWLNPVRSYDDGYMITGKEGRNGNFILQIADCGRIVTLDLYWDCKKVKNLRMKKIDLMIRDLQHLRQKMEEAPDV